MGSTLQPGRKLVHIISATVDRLDFQASFFVGIKQELALCWETLFYTQFR